MLWIVAYFAVAVVLWGSFIAIIPERDMAGTNVLMALAWPLTALLVIGYLLAAGWRS